MNIPGSTYDFAIIGGGIIGCSVARQLLSALPDARVVLLEKEATLGAHQTGHNSGVIHAGIYYTPGSLKAELCKQGNQATYRFCEENGIAHQRCGKLLVATNEAERERMLALYERGRQGGLDCDLLDESGLRALEPRINGVGAIHVHATGIADYPAIAQRMGEQFVQAGGRLLLECRVQDITEVEGGVRLATPRGPISAGHVIVCAGIQADRMARLAGLEPGFVMVPFRGEYYRLAPHLNEVTRKLIYPIPDPDLPFLGIHLTRMVDGSVTVGPNAVLGFAREGYPRFSFNPADVKAYAAFSGFWRLLSRHRRPAMREFVNSVSKSNYLNACRKYCPELRTEDLLDYPAGIRAQAVTKTGEMIYDFLIEDTEHMTHVYNAPSPAATSAIPIGRHIVDGVLRRKSAVSRSE